MRDAKPLAAPPDAAAKARAQDAGALLGDVEARRIVFVDGAFVPELSDLGGLEPGLTIGSLAEALGRRRSGAARASRQGSRRAATSRYALNTAFMGDGAVIARRAGRDRSSGRCISSSSPRTSRPRRFARSLVVVEHGARA